MAPVQLSAAPRGELRRSVESKIERARPIAFEQLSRRGTCRLMFSDLNLDAETALAALRFVPATRLEENRLCRRASAFTRVGSAEVKVCRAFGDLSNRQAAQILLHEALHAAGLPEWPGDPRAMTSVQINQWVAESCDL